MKKLVHDDPCPCGSGKKYGECCRPRDDIQAALEHHRAGRLAEAQTIYRNVLQYTPDHPDALYLSGMLAHQAGNSEMALALINKAISAQPSSMMYCNLGNVLQDLGKFDAAVEAYHRALAIQPRYADALNNLGLALEAQGRRDAAVENYRKAVAVQPHHVEALNNLGLAFEAQGRHEAAAGCYRKVLAVQPNFIKSHFNLGLALQQQGKLDAAAESYRKALAIQPNFPEALNGLGNVLQAQARFDAAADSYRKALAIRPDYAEALNNLGNVLQAQGQPGAAAENYRKALALRPDFADALNNLGNALQAHCRFDAAIESYRKALAIKPDFYEAHSNLLFTLNLDAGCLPAQYLAEARRYGADVTARATPYTSWPACQGPRALPLHSLRVGLVSGDLKRHPAGYFLESMLAQLNPAAIELVAYSTHAYEDELTFRIKPCFAAWNSIAELDDQAAARKIHDDGIHILIDLAGHTAHNRLPVFAWKPAPVQVAWLGYFATTGLEAMDFILCDSQVLPENEAQHFVEKPWRLPHTRLCFSPPAQEIATARLPALQNGIVTFGCFNNLAKMNDAVVALWAQILKAVNGSRLMLKSRQLQDPSVRQDTASRFAAAGIDPARLILEGASPRAEYLETFNRIDIGLDPFPYTGGATSVESLWMGVPFITRRGDRMLAHQGEGILRNAGLPDWIAADDKDYVARAAAHASRLDTLAKLRGRLRAQLLASPLCDAPQFARDLEAALQGMWRAASSSHE